MALWNPMESESFPLIEAPPSVPGSVPLTNRRREQYCRLRVLGVSPIAAARDSGFTAGLSSPTAETDKNAGLRGVISKLERNAKIKDRIRYLAGNSDDVLRQKRAALEAPLWNIFRASIKDYTRITDSGGLVLDASPIAELPEDEQRELLAVVKSVSPTKYGPRVEMFSPLDAASQLRALNGLDAPKRMEMSGPDGGPIETQDLSVRELISSRIARLAAAPTAPGDN